MFRAQHFLFCPLTSFSFLPAEFFDLCLFFREESFLPTFNFIQQKPARQVAIQGLRSLPLTFYGQAGRDVEKMNAGRCFIDFLSAGSGRTDKGLLKIGFGNTEFPHPCRERSFFFSGYRHGPFLS